MHFRKIGTKMLVTIVPVILLAQIVLTVISSISSSNLVLEQTEATMEAELSANEEKIAGDLENVRTMAAIIASSVGQTYKVTDMKLYEEMLGEVINTNDMVSGSGLWFEPYVYDSKEKYMGPYVYKDGSSLVTTYDYSNAEYDYFSQDYYTMALAADEPIITDPYYDPTSATIMSSCSTPIFDGGTKIGCVTVDIVLSSIKEEIDAVKVGEDGTAMLVTSSGVYLAGVDNQKIENASLITEDENESLAAMGAKVLANASGVETFISTSGDTMSAYYEEIEVVGWKLIIQIPSYELQRPVLLMINKLILVCIIAIIAAIIIIILGIGGIAKSVQTVQLFAKTLASGDFTVNNLVVNGQDELSQMSESLNEMYGSNKDVITNISDRSKEITLASGNLKKAAEELKEQFDNISTVMASINSDMMNSSAATEELTASVDQVAQSTEVLDKNTKESLALALEIEKRADEIGHTSQAAFDKAQVLQESYELKLAESIAQSKVVESIGEMAAVISDIADQITLLSLNASIEAARAGEQGKGFAVVATEIGKLAGETTQSVEKIQETIQSVQGAFEGLATNAKVLLEFVTETVTPDYKNFVGVADQYANDAESIKATSEKLSQMTESIQQIMSEVSFAINNIAESTQNTAENSSDIMESVEQVHDVVLDINSMSEQQSEISHELSNVVHRFKLAVSEQNSD